MTALAKKRGKTQKNPELKLVLLGLRLVESESKLSELKAAQLPGHGTQYVNATVELRDDNKEVVVNIRITLHASYDGDQTKDPAISLMASFVANYSIEEFPGKDVIEKIMPQIGMSNIWPYWREFAQSITTRMGLPAFPLPLVNTALQKADK